MSLKSQSQATYTGLHKIFATGTNGLTGATPLNVPIVGLLPTDIITAHRNLFAGTPGHFEVQAGTDEIILTGQAGDTSGINWQVWRALE